MVILLKLAQPPESVTRLTPRNREGTGIHKIVCIIRSIEKHTEDYTRGDQPDEFV